MRFCTAVCAATLMLANWRTVAADKSDGAGATVKTLDQFSRDQMRVFLRGFSGDWRAETDERKGIAAPPIQGPCGANAVLIDLVRPDKLTLGRAPLIDIINQRRSRRAFSDAALTNEELSYLLWCTQGISSIARDEDGRVTHHFRTVPSGGARHPFETYLAVNRVNGITPGVYRFLPVEHKLLQVREVATMSAEVRKACYGQSFVSEAAVVFIWTAVPYRAEWRYGIIAHRMIAIEAGHVCQNLYLAAESIGSGTCALLGYSQRAMDTLVGVDGNDAFTIYVAPVGKVNAQ